MTQNRVPQGVPTSPTSPGGAVSQRVPRGTPAGGQFAAQDRAEAGLDLTEVREMIRDEYGDGTEHATYGDPEPAPARTLLPRTNEDLTKRAARADAVLANLTAAPREVIKTGGARAAVAFATITLASDHIEPVANLVSHDPRPVAVAAAAVAALTSAVTVYAKGAHERTSHPIRKAREDAAKAKQAEAREALLDRLVEREAARVEAEDDLEAVEAALARPRVVRRRP